MEKKPQSAMSTNNATAQTVCNHTEMIAPPSRPQRLLSLDVMRGLDMFFLVVIGPILTTWQRIWGLPAWLNTQLRHVDWEGLTAWDLIMPWFIFMCGAAIPLQGMPVADGVPARQWILTTGTNICGFSVTAFPATAG